jgi:ribosomal protein L11 methyltransferase
MDYTEVKISISPYNEQYAEIITALLADIGFDSFAEFEEGLSAYIPSQNYKEEILSQTISELRLSSEISYSSAVIKSQNWNEEWEKNFSPITIGEQCYVRAPFHEPKSGFEVEIVIEPKMAFGTGHHETTWLVANELFNINLKDKKVLDMGCGTGILAIVAEKLGAQRVTAIDNDTWAYKNAKENIVANSSNNIEVILGDASTLENNSYDIILANINLNILMADMGTYVKHLEHNGVLVMSGILASDVETLKSSITKHGLTFIDSKSRNKWALVTTKKIVENK